MELVLLVGVLSAIASSAITALVCAHRFRGKLAASSAGEDHVLDLRLEREFERGRAAGRKEELGNFNLTYEPFVETTEEYMGLKKRSALGYYMQIHYAGFPIGHQMRYVTHSNVEYDPDRVDALLNNEVAAAVNGIVQLAITKGMGAKALPAGRRRAAS